MYNFAGVQKGCDANICFHRREMHQPLHPNSTLTYTSVGSVTPSNPLQGCGNQSLWRSGSVSKRDMGVLSGQPGGILGPGRAGWCTLAAGCASSVEAEEAIVAPVSYTHLDVYKRQTVQSLAHSHHHLIIYVTRVTSTSNHHM